MINLKWLDLPMAQTLFHGPKGVRAIEVGLYKYVLSLYEDDPKEFMHRVLTQDETVSIATDKALFSSENC